MANLGGERNRRGQSPVVLMRHLTGHAMRSEVEDFNGNLFPVESVGVKRSPELFCIYRTNVTFKQMIRQSRSLPGVNPVILP